jgi:hypothetical protein
MRMEQERMRKKAVVTSNKILLRQLSGGIEDKSASLSQDSKCTGYFSGP